MSDTYLYRQAIPEQAQTRTVSQVRRELSKLAGIEGASQVEDLGVSPGDYVIEGQYRGKYAPLMARELEELFSADDAYATVPYFAKDGSLPGAGYYSLSNVDVGRSDPRHESVQEFDGVLTKEGTRESHRRSITVNSQQVHRNDFGNSTEALVAIPAAAENRFWYDRESRTREEVSVASTASGEGSKGDVDLVDAHGVSELTAPFELVYDVDYDTDGQVDVILWDDYGREKLDAEGVNSWQWVFSTSHGYSGTPVIDTGRLRVYLDTTGGLQAEEYDSSSESWTGVSLPASDWTLHDCDVVEVAPNRVHVQVEFENASTNEVRALNLIARRGRRLVHWLVPNSIEDPTPDGLVDRLQPVADESVLRPQSSLGLIAREELRR